MKVSELVNRLITYKNLKNDMEIIFQDVDSGEQYDLTEDWWGRLQDDSGHSIRLTIPIQKRQDWESFLEDTLDELLGDKQ